MNIFICIVVLIAAVQACDMHGNESNDKITVHVSWKNGDVFLEDEKGRSVSNDNIEGNYASENNIIAVRKYHNGRSALGYKFDADVIGRCDDELFVQKYLHGMRPVNPDEDVLPRFIVLNNNFGVPFVFAHKPDMTREVYDGYCYVCSLLGDEWNCVSYGEDKKAPLKMLLTKKRDAYVNFDEREHLAVVEYDFGTFSYYDYAADGLTFDNVKQLVLDGYIRPYGTLESDWFLKYENQIRQYKKLDGLLISELEWESIQQ